jgi:hypothetical protein
VNYGPRIARNGLILALDMADKNSYIGSGTSWKDMSGSNYTATIINSSFYNIFGGIIFFNGTSDYVSISNSSSINFTNSSGTISIWFRTGILPVSGSFLLSKNMDSTGGWALSIGADGIPYFETKNNASGAASFYRFADKVCTDGLWHNFVAVFTTSTTVLADNTVSIYIDGVLSDGALFRSLVYGGNTTGNVEIARRTTGNYYSGYISNIQIYNRQLTAKEILYNYNNIAFRYKVAIAYDWFSGFVLAYVRGNGNNGDTTVPNLILGGGNLTTTGVGSITNVQSKWGGTSLRIDSGSNGVTIPVTISSIGTGDFTIECWYYASSLRSDVRFIGGGGANAFSLGSRVVGQRTIGIVKEGVSWFAEATWSSVLLNQWVHIAACRSGANIRYFQNGVQIGGAISFTQSMDMPAPFIAGVNATASPTYYNDVRITRAALYTTAFTAPTSQFNLPY